LIGRATGTGRWTVDLAETAQGHHGAARVLTASGESAVFFAANPKAGVALEVSGAAPVGSDDVVVVHSTGPVKRLPRSPSSRFGRTGRGGARHVDMAKLLQEAEDLPDLEQRFRQEAAL
jgi:hypothetical protein